MYTLGDTDYISHWRYTYTIVHQKIKKQVLDFLQDARNNIKNTRGVKTYPYPTFVGRSQYDMGIIFFGGRSPTWQSNKSSWSCVRCFCFILAIFMCARRICGVSSVSYSISSLTVMCRVFCASMIGIVVVGRPG